MVSISSRNHPALRQIDDLGLSLYVESRDGRQQLIAADRRNCRRYAVDISSGQEDDAPDRLLAAIRASSN